MGNQRAEGPAGRPRGRRAAVVMLAVAGLLTTPLAAQVEVAIDVSAKLGTIHQPFDTLSSFRPGSPPRDLRKAAPFITHYCLFNAFGASPKQLQHELYDEDADGNAVYHFDRLTEHLDAILEADLVPYLVLGGCPVKLARKPPDGKEYYNTITCGPADMQKYEAFVAAFFAHLDERYTAAAVASWRYRFMTEADGFEWWKGTREEWFEFYRATVVAAHGVNPGVRICPANMTLHDVKQPDGWLRQYIAEVTGQGGKGEPFPYVPPMVTFSFYRPWAVNGREGPWQLEPVCRTIREILPDTPAFRQVRLGVDEGYVGVDEEKTPLWARVDATEWGASHFAAMACAAVNNGVDSCCLWSAGDPAIPSATRHALTMFVEFDGMMRLGSSCTPAHTEEGRSAFGLAAGKGKRLRLMLVSRHFRRDAEGSREFAVSFTNMPARRTLRVDHRQIDRDHGNYRRQWLLDTSHLEREGRSSRYDLHPLTGLRQNAEAKDLWGQTNRKQYEQLSSDLHIRTWTVKSGSDGGLGLILAMPVQSVALLELTLLD